MARILMVDDEKDLQVLIHQRFRKQIQENYFEFIFAHNGFEALEIFETRHPVDILVTDIHMPGMDGLTLLDKVSVSSPQTRAIVLSAYDDIQNLRRAMNHGAFDFMTKPLNFIEFEEVLGRSLQQKKQGEVPSFVAEKTVFDFFEKDFFQENLASFSGLSLKKLFSATAKKNKIILDAFATEQGPVLVILIAGEDSLLARLRLIKMRDALRALALVQKTAPEQWIENLRLYEQKFIPFDFSLAVCCVDREKSFFKAVCAPEERFFLEEEGSPLKQPLTGTHPLFLKKSTLLHTFKAPEKIIPLLFFKKSPPI